MARNINRKLPLSDGAKASIAEDVLSISGAKGELSLNVHDTVKVSLEEDSILFNPKDLENKISVSMTSTMRSLALNMIEGVTKGFEKKLEINGVGYRVKVSGANLELSLGYSHPINYKLPDGVNAEAPTNTELVLTSTNKQLLGDTASEIRAFRPPEPYKGKGVKYSDEHIKRKESKKTA
jgi:large subunit ribosomal protein L6|tara:strand:- start:267 stop:806 length:540 start_codon:yes stop_codon:yes gene_type:complete